jgi:hypothetical protein
MFARFGFGDSGAELVVQDLLRSGYRPTLDFGHVYGLLPLLMGRAWYGLFGISPESFRGLALVWSIVLAWGLARFLAARPTVPAAVALVVLAVPDMLLVSSITSVHIMEPAVLVHAVAFQVRGCRAAALAAVTACVFVKPSMAYLYGLYLVIALGLANRRNGLKMWLREFAPAAVTGALMAVVLGLVFGLAPLANTIFPRSGLELYRESHYGFFHGSGRRFWIIPGAGLRDYFRYEVGFWLIGTLVLLWGGLSSFWRLAMKRGGRATTETLDDEVVACCALLHVAFVTLFFGNYASWTYYFTILILGLAALSWRSRASALVIWILAALLLASDRAKLTTTADRWTTMRATSDTLNLWATPEERAQWDEVRERTRGENPTLVALHEGAALLTPGFMRPVGGFFDPGFAIPAEIHRKAEQLAAAKTIVRAVPADWRGFTLWPELTAALDGCSIVWQGSQFAIYQRDRPPSGSARSLPP